MKKLIKIGGVVALLLAVGCNDYLMETNKSDIVANEYYQTDSGYDKLVNSTYSQLRTLYGGDPWMYTAGTDMYVPGRNAMPEELNEYRNLTPDNGIVTNYYQNVYHAIQMANTAIFYNDKTESTSTLDSRLGEMKFLRAFFYFNLVRQFGGVALVKNRIDDPVLSFERNSAEEVYNFIISEMEQALDLVREEGQPGRIDKRVVRHYLAKVHLTRGYKEYAASDDFDKAASYADAAINGQPLSLTYEDFWYPANDENSEVIFAVQYDEASMIDPQEDGNKQAYYFGPYLGGEGATEGYPYRAYTLCANMYVFDLYTQHDARWEASFMEYYYDRYYDYYDQKGSRDQLDIQTYYAPKWAVDDTTQWRNEDPEHRDSTNIIGYSQDWEADISSVDNAAPIVKKFDDPNSAFAPSSSSRDIRLAHLGETYLLAAEAYHQLGNISVAAERINEVRRRAAKSGSANQMLIQPGDVDIDLILDERALELLGEYHRWYDLKRTGKLVERTRQYNREIKAWFDNGTNPFIGPDGNPKILRPIPQSAIDLNNAEVEQNSGY